MCVYYDSIKRELKGKPIHETWLFNMNGLSESYKEDQCRIVGTMKDEKVKLRGLHVSYTMG